MAKSRQRRSGSLFSLAIGVLALGIAWIAATTFMETDLAAPVQFSLKQGSGLRSVARQLQNAGVIDSALRFELLARAYRQ